MFPFRRKKSIRRKRRNAKPVSMVRHIAYGIASMLVVVSLGTSIWYVTRLEAVTITSVEVAGGETISHEAVRERVEQELVGNYLLLIPHRFVYLYPHDAIVSSIENIPRIHDVTLTRAEPNTLSVSFSEYLPYALWCLTGDDTAPCYFIDTTGFAFAPAPPLRGGALTRYVVEGETELAKRQVVEPASLEVSHAFIAVLDSEFGLRTRQVTYTEVGDVIFKISGGGDIITSLRMSSEETLLNLQSILTSDDFNHIEPGNFKYIDLRFGNKVFVNEELDTASTTEETPL